MSGELVKKCKACKELKPLSEFRLNRTMRDGHRSSCKSCDKEYGRCWRVKNLERTREYDRQYKTENPEKIKEKNLRYRIKNSEKIKEKKRRYRIKNSEKEKERLRRARKKYRATLKGALRHAISNAVGRSFKKDSKAGRSWEELVGYTINDLKKHLEKRFQPGMSWGNYGKWHIDHEIPISVFNFETPEDSDFKLCWSLKNLQPMWAKENISKSNKLSKPFQPSFAFAPTQTI
jgi:hypothetical protein